jgi:hypothetical protein
MTSDRPSSVDLAQWAGLMAEECIAAAAADDVLLDYSGASVARIEEWLKANLRDWRPWRRRSCVPARRHAYLQKPIGAYVGEVIVRNLGGRWAWNESEDACGVHLIDASWAFPLHKTQRRFENGDIDDLNSFYRVVELTAAGELPEPIDLAEE